MTETISDCVEIHLHSEHGRIPRNLLIVLPEIITPDAFLDLIHEYFERCEVNGTFEGLAWLIEDAYVITSPNVDDYEYTPAYSYSVGMFPEAALDGGAPIELTIDNKVDEPYTANITAISKELAASLA